MQLDGTFDKIRFILFDNRHYIASRLSISGLRRACRCEIPDSIVALEVSALEYSEPDLSEFFVEICQYAEALSFEEWGRGIFIADLAGRTCAAVVASPDLVLCKESSPRRRFKTVSLDEIQSIFWRRKLENYLSKSRE